MDIDEKSSKFVSEDEISEFIKDYKNHSKSQMSDFKNPKLFKGWDIRYSKLQKFKGFAKALISTLKNHVSLDTIYLEIASKNIKVYTILGEYDSVVNFDDFKVRSNRIMPNRKEFFIESAGHLPQMESPSEFNSIKFLISLNKINTEMPPRTKEEKYDKYLEFKINIFLLTKIELTTEAIIKIMNAIEIKIIPRIKNWNLTGHSLWKINWGNILAKNNITFGLLIFITKPTKNGLLLLFFDFSILFFFFLVNSI